LSGTFLSNYLAPSQRVEPCLGDRVGMIDRCGGRAEWRCRACRRLRCGLPCSVRTCKTGCRCRSRRSALVFPCELRGGGWRLTDRTVSRTSGRIGSAWGISAAYQPQHIPLPSPIHCRPGICLRCRRSRKATVRRCHYS